VRRSGARHATRSARKAPAGTRRSATLDGAALLSRVEGDGDLLRDLVDAFLGEAPQLLREIKRAIKCGDCAKLFNAAHTLKGAASILEAHKASQTAEKLESSGEQGDLSEAGNLLMTLTAEVRSLQTELAELLRVTAS
jgi:two-component system, sensor histidine kinase and response regulator